MTLNHIAKVSVAAFLALAGMAASADTQSLAVSAAVKDVCTFTPGVVAMDFGTLDPSAAADTPGTLTGAVSYKCTKGTTPGTLSADNGANFSVKRRMSNGTDFLPYTLSLSAATAGAGFGAGKEQAVTLTAGVLGADYVNISKGAYSDSVTLTVAP